MKKSTTFGKDSANMDHAVDPMLDSRLPLLVEKLSKKQHSRPSQREH